MKHKPSKDVPQKATYALLKAMHHTRAAEFYFNLTAASMEEAGPVPTFLKDRGNECGKVVSKMIDRMKNSSVRELIEQELEDPLQMDVFLDTYMSLSQPLRTQLEDVMAELINIQLKLTNPPSEDGEQKPINYGPQDSEVHTGREPG